MPTLDSGAPFGTYLIEGFIARGGMGEVYAARHSVYGSPVAIKVLHPHLDHEEAWRLRFSEEGVVGQTLKHPHILSARELVEEEGRVGIVMDLVPGAQTLLKVLTREFPQGLPLSDGLHVFLGIVQAVEYAHGKGIVHGDLKPENIMVQGDFRSSSTWIPKVTDFGTVGLLAHPVLIDGQQAVVASPRYASPEHLLGTDALAQASDIYCLGLLLHFLLTGKHASGATTVEEALEFVRRPVPVTAMVDLPDAAIGLVRQCAALQLEERVPSCRDLALRVRQLLDDLGDGLQLQDLQGDIATEIMEERQRLREEQAACEAEQDSEVTLPAPEEQPQDEIAGDRDSQDQIAAEPPPEIVPQPPERIPGIMWVAAAIGLLVILAILAMSMPH